MEVSERNELVMKWSGLVFQMARKYGYYHIKRNRADLMDFFQSGMLGLIRAAEKFDPAKGVQFPSYAGVAARNEMLSSLRHLTFVSSPHLRKLKSRECVLLRRNVYKGVVFSQLENAYPDERIQDWLTPVFDDRPLDEEEETAKNERDVATILAWLKDEKKKDIVMRRFGNEEPLVSIGDDWGISKERVRQLQNATINRIRNRWIMEYRGLRLRRPNDKR